MSGHLFRQNAVRWTPSPSSAQAVIRPDYMGLDTYVCLWVQVPVDVCHARTGRTAPADACGNETPPPPPPTIWMHQVNGTGNSPVSGTDDPRSSQTGQVIRGLR